MPEKKLCLECGEQFESILKNNCCSLVCGLRHVGFRQTATILEHKVSKEVFNYETRNN